MSVKTICEELAGDRKGTKKFGEKKFDKLAVAMLNDLDFAYEAGIIKSKELVGEEKIYPSKEFRSFLKKVLIQFGVDKNESEKVMEPDFQIKSAEGLYKFFATAVKTFMDEGGTAFDFIPTKDFKASLSVKEVEETTKQKSFRNPQTGDVMGPFDVTTKKHKKIVAKSSAHPFLSSRKESK